MPQTRNRRPPKISEPSRKVPADYVTNNVKGNGGNKGTSKIPRNIRYDLENALLGLCDVWFEEIKPHLVKNKLKLHTGGALNENGYSELEPRRDGHAQLDPGAASDTLRRPAAISRAYSLTRPDASKAPRPKQPLRICPTSPTNLRKLLQVRYVHKRQPPVRKVTAREHSPPTLAINYPRNVHESSKQWKQPPVQKTPVQRPPAPPLTQTGKTYQRTVPNSSKRNPPQRGSSPPPKQTYQPNTRTLPKQEAPPQRVTPLAQTCHQINHYAAERTEWKRNTNYYASSNRKKRKSARTHRSTQIPSSSVPPPRRVARPCCTACVLAKDQTVPIPRLPVTKFTPSKPPSNNKNANFPRWPAPEPKFPHKFPTRDCAVSNDSPIYTTSISPAGDVPPSLVAESPFSALKLPSRNSTYDHASTAISPSHFRKKSPFSHHGARLLPAPLHAKCLVPPEHPIASPRGSQPVSRNVSPALSSDEMWFLRVFNEYTKPENQTKSPIKEPTLPCHDTKTSRRTIPIHNENKLLLEDTSSLFSKDLIDLIGNKNDKRLRMLYKNPCGQESQSSVMCLAGSRKKRIKSTPKKMPWR
ncbi:proteoglycan 4-like [Cydia amplana]|uniref:proteoglycan 4-like n=1 Tax=Cydia amplana TaxID=1869771 RepID=UPI002FE50E09